MLLKRFDDFTINARKHSNTAVDYAKSFGKNLDFSSKSIADLEKILDFYSDDIKICEPTEKQAWTMDLIFGSYLGETMLSNGLRKKGFVWDIIGDSHIPVLKLDKDNYLTPINKVFNRLINGDLDNTISFYDVFMKDFDLN